MGYLSAKDEGNQFFKHVPHLRDFTRSSGTFPLKSAFSNYDASREFKEHERSIK